MEKLKKLIHAKRILAMILAITMVVTMVPTDVYASTETEGVQEEVVEVVEESEDITQLAEGETPVTPVYALQDNLADEYKTAVYCGWNPFDTDTILSNIMILENDVIITSAYDVYYSGYSGFSSVNLTWQKEGTDGTYADTAAVLDVGNYKLIVDIIGEDGITSAAKTEVNFVITKAPLYAWVELGEVLPGTKAADVVVAGVRLADAENNIILESTTENSPLSYKLVSVENAITGEALENDAVLVNTEDYIANVEITIAETANVSNYDISSTVNVREDIYVGALIETVLEVQLGEAYKENGYISHSYTGEAIAAPVKDTDYTASAKYETAEGYAPIENAVLTGTWYDESGYELEGAPVDAGTYYYEIVYAGEKGIYAGCSSSIEVVINQAVLTIVPEIEADAAFYNGTTVEEVLSKVDYTVYVGEKELEIDRSYFWGVRENYSFTQAYEPVFRVQQVIKNEETGSFEYVNLNSDEILNKENSYRVVFTGNKAVYRLEYSSVSTVNVNNINYDCTNENYIVDVSSATLGAKEAQVEVKEGVAADINVTAILGTDNAGATKENPIKAVYDGDNLYASRTDYKKAAVITRTDNTIVAETTNEAITYTWYKYDVYDEDYYEVGLYLGSPINAGDYKLVISYEDDSNYYHADPVEVYYTIEKQKVNVYGYGEYTAYTGEVIYDFVESSYFNSYLTITPENGVEEDFNVSIYYYDVYWVVQKTTDAENWTTITDENEVFVKDTFYRLVPVDLEFYISTYANNYTFGQPKTAGLINVKEMGTTELTVTVDETKLTSKSKVYDGEEINIWQDFSNGAIVIGDGTTEIPDELGWYWLSENDNYVSAPVDAGTYTFYLSFAGNADYKPFDTDKALLTVTISPRELTIVPAVKDTVAAGSAAEDVYTLAGTKFEGVADVDAEAFAYQNGGWEAAEVTFGVYDENNNPVTSKLKGNTTYKVGIVSAALNGDWATNYDLNLEETVEFTTVRGNSTVKHATTESIEAVKVKDTVDGMTHTVIPEAAIPYSFNGYGNLEEGNLIAIKIVIPEEYEYIPDTTLYQNSINAACGIVWEVTDTSIVAIFDASEKDTKEFSIRWEDGYVEDYVLDFTNATLMANLEEAVAPKAISLIKPSKKMVVGGTQQLDVKLTKTQESDIILLSYETSDDSVLYVSEYGSVTALAKGTATVTVSPSKLVNGELVPIENAKKASVKITVSDVTAPKIKKVTATDERAKVIFNLVSDGYRDEVYVLEGKNKTVADFEKAIDSMNNGIWEGIFAVAPTYDAYYDYDAKTVYADLYDLKANTDYTVYVRNVSRICEVAEGYQVSESAAGSVKSFKTTKKQIDDLNILLNYQDIKYDYMTGEYNIKLSKGSTTFGAEGYFEDSDGAFFYADLPLSSALKKEYVSPKLSYYVFDENGNATSLASINKSGKLTLKGVGSVVVIVADNNSGKSDYLYLNITAAADSFTGKTANLKLGESVDLSELVTYKEGKKVLTGDYAGALIIDAEIEQIFAENEYFELDGTTVKAVKTGGTLVINVKDANIPDKTATITLKSGKSLDPVKSLKSTMTTDQYIDLQFTHNGYAEAFRIEVTDARGNVVHSVYAPANQIRVDDDVFSYRVSGLTKKSKYNVVVTALYGDEESAATKKSFTTTLLPASYTSLAKGQYGGVDISEMTYGYYLDEGPYIVTGNTYTLHMMGNLMNQSALFSGTDTLTWSSSNKKVATVKANKSTFGASLTAVGQGYTTIEVKSKITKAVIARYEIYVYAVGNAYNYYGTNEPQYRNTVADTKINLDAEVGDIGGATRLTLGEEVSVSTTAGTYKWLAFTAPSNGYYCFESSGSGDPKAWFCYDMKIGDTATSSDLNTYSQNNGYGYDDDSGSTGNNFYKQIYLEAGTTVYIAVGHFSLNSAINTTVTVNRVN